MRYDSIVLGNSFKVRATLGLQREIDRVGGFDRYIYYTPEEKLVNGSVTFNMAVLEIACGYFSCLT